MNFRGDKVPCWGLVIVFVDSAFESCWKFSEISRLSSAYTRPLMDMQTIVLLDTQLTINKFMKKVVNLIHKNNNR